MADRTCELCGKVFTKPFLLGRHLGRKTPCAPILEPEDLPGGAEANPYQCKFCNRIYSSYEAMRRHVRQSCKIAPNKKNGDAGMQLLYEHTARRQEARIATLEQQNAQMFAMVKQITEKGGEPIGHQIQVTGDSARIMSHVDQHVDQRVQIVIAHFGNEDVSHIDRDRIRALLDEILPPKGLPAAYTYQDAVLKAAMMIFSDPDYPENITCYLPNKKTADALVHSVKGWDIQPVHLVTPQMARLSINLLFDKQPLEGSDEYAQIMRDLADNEHRYVTNTGPMKTVLIRNKDLLARILERLPVAGRM